MKMKLINCSAVISAMLFFYTESIMGQGAPSNMVWVPPGNFVMGDTFSEGDPPELPLHTVYASGFYMDKYEVTLRLWNEIKTWSTANGYSFDNSGLGNASDHPAHTVNWYDAIKWCNTREKENRVPAYYTDAGLTTIYKTGQQS